MRGSFPLATRAASGAQVFIYAVFGAELVLFTWCRLLWGPYASPVMLYLLGITLGISVLVFARRKRFITSSASVGHAHSSLASRGLRLRAAALLAGAVAGGWYLTNQAKHSMRDFGLHDGADIIPALHAYTGRWLSGAEVYAPLTWELGYFELPTYLPAMWFPFVLPEWLGFDYRFMAWGIFLAGTAAYMVVLWRLQRPWFATLLLALLPFGSFQAMLDTHWAIVGINVEYMILGYYSLLVVGILLRCWPLQALGLLLCLLSRYSLVFWVPLLLLLLFFQASRRQAVLVAGTVALGIVAGYLVPFLSHDWGMFMAVQHSYTNAAVGEWTHIGRGGVPEHLYNGLGLAIFFLHYGSGTLFDKVEALKTVQVVSIVLVVAAAGWAYLRQRAPRTDYRVYAVVVLKLYLATFYAFIQVPYPYLFVVSIFLSVFLVLITAGLTPASPEHPTAARPAQ